MHIYNVCIYNICNIFNEKCLVTLYTFYLIFSYLDFMK